MATAAYVIEGKEAQCPQCEHPRFSGPAKVKPGDVVICAKCRQASIVDPAVPAGLRAVGGKKFVPDEPY